LKREGLFAPPYIKREVGKVNREEFYRVTGFNPEEAKRQNITTLQGRFIREYVFLRSIYNQRNRMYTASFQSFPSNYAAKMSEIWTRSTAESLNREEDLEEAFAKSRIAKTLKSRGHPVQASFVVHPVYAGNLPEPHHWEVYAVFTIEAEHDVLDYGPGYKRKVYIYTQDGVLEIKLPDFNIKDQGPTGFTGMKHQGGITTLCGVTFRKNGEVLEDGKEPVF